MDFSNTYIYFSERSGPVTSLKYGFALMPKHGQGLGLCDTTVLHGVVRHQRTSVEMYECPKFSCTDPNTGRGRNPTTRR